MTDKWTGFSLITRTPTIQEALMERLLGAYAPYLYAIMRIVLGVLFACHGAQKLFGVLGGETVALFSLRGLAGIIECIGGLLIAMGFLTSYAAFIASGEMATAYFMAHAPRGFWPIQNGGERAVLYCFLFLYIASRGVGVWGIDKARHTP
jgi:putative oxidoreductase